MTLSNPAGEHAGTPNAPIRHTVDTLNSDALDELYARLDRAEEEARQYAAADSADAAAGSYALRAETAEAERDGAYRERAHLLAWLAALHPAVRSPAPDVDEPDWQILYLYSSKRGWQMSWHIAPRDADLFTDVEQVPADDPRAQWDGHTTEQKYTRMRTHVHVVHMNNRLGADDCVVCEGSGRCPGCHTTIDEPGEGEETK